MLIELALLEYSFQESAGAGGEVDMAAVLLTPTTSLRCGAARRLGEIEDAPPAPAPAMVVAGATLDLPPPEATSADC